METAIPAVVIAGILVLCAALLSDVTNDSVTNVGDSWRDIEAISEERLGTDLAVVTTGTSGNDVVTVTLRNDGRTAITDFALMDLIINYDGAGSNRYNTWLPYTEEASQPDNTWKITSFTNDNKNPGMLDMGEEMTVSVQVDPNITGANNRWISLATPTGITYTISF